MCGPCVCARVCLVTVYAHVCECACVCVWPGMGLLRIVLHGGWTVLSYLPSVVSPAR